MTEQRYNKDQIETIVLQTIMARPYKDFGGNRVYPVNAVGEEAVIKGLKGTKEITSLFELEQAMSEPEVSNIYIAKDASVTSKGLKNVLERSSLTKDVFCAFKVKD